MYLRTSRGVSHFWHICFIFDAYIKRYVGPTLRRSHTFIRHRNVKWSTKNIHMASLERNFYTTSEMYMQRTCLADPVAWTRFLLFYVYIKHAECNIELEIIFIDNLWCHTCNHIYFMQDYNNTNTNFKKQSFI